jgi:DNA-binding LacI/PurR family transcriptional regulator
MRRHESGGLVIPGGRTEESGAVAAHTLLDAEPMPTAVLAFNDRCAMGLIDTVVRAGVDIPGRISVVGYDDSPVARLAHIDLTTVSQNTEQITEHAVRALIEKLEDGRVEDREVVVPPRLVIRGTARAPHGNAATGRSRRC